jgi:hypothetical protein
MGYLFKASRTLTFEASQESTIKTFQMLTSLKFFGLSQ